jgi:hypothetical protein
MNDLEVALKGCANPTCVQNWFLLFFEQVMQARRQTFIFGQVIVFSTCLDAPGVSARDVGNGPLEDTSLNSKN